MTLSYPLSRFCTDIEHCRRRVTRGGRPVKKTAAFWRTVVLLPVVCLLICGSAAGIEAAIGDTIPLAGTSYGGPYVYLFLTGPNLPSDGVALHDVTLPAHQGGLTRVSVGDNDRWEYDWDTHAIGGRLDAGTYTIWVTTIPTGRSGLVSGEYGTRSVTLRSPGLSLATTVQSGAISFMSSPPGASVTLDGQYLGKTPLGLTDLPPNTYNATISLPGYRTAAFAVTVDAGATTEAAATLEPLAGSLAVTTDPPGARILLDGRDAGTSPIVISDVSAGRHMVSAQLDGYMEAGGDATVAAGRTGNITLILAPDGHTPRPTYAGSPGPVFLATGTGALLFAALTRRRRR